MPEPTPPTGRTCCDLHNTHCEPPSELCCRFCTETAHPEHADGFRCVLAEPTGRTTDHASKLDSSHASEHAARDRIAAAARTAFRQWVLDEGPAHEVGQHFADAVLAALPELAELDRLHAPADSALRERQRAAARRAFADRTDAEGSLSISTQRNPWAALNDALSAAFAVRDTELDRLRAEAEEGWRAKDAAVQRAEKAEGLLEIALHLCRHGDLAPGGGETWADWARATETHLRGKEAPDVR